MNEKVFNRNQIYTKTYRTKTTTGYGLNEQYLINNNLYFSFKREWDDILNLINNYKEVDLFCSELEKLNGEITRAFELIINDLINELAKLGFEISNPDSLMFLDFEYYIYNIKKGEKEANNLILKSNGQNNGNYILNYLKQNIEKNTNKKNSSINNFQKLKDFLEGNEGKKIETDELQKIILALFKLYQIYLIKCFFDQDNYIIASNRINKNLDAKTKTFLELRTIFTIIKTISNLDFYKNKYNIKELDYFF